MLPTPSVERALFQQWPRLQASHGFLPLGNFPTPVEPLRPATAAGGSCANVYVKRDDLSSPLYGGNKVRTLEALLGQAYRLGSDRVVATGAYGSNHAVATALHARRAGFRAAVALFPQPFSETALANLRVSLTQADEITDLPHWSALPYAIWRRGGIASSGPGGFVMPPGGAIARGCLGFMSAGLELAAQIDAGSLPRPEEVVIALGSTCSTAGLLVGLRLAARLGLGFGHGGARSARSEPPRLVAVRVTPWPLTSALRILALAQRLTTWLLRETQDACFDLPRPVLARGLELDGGQLGAGYGRTTRAGLAAIEQLSTSGFALDTCYSAKSAAALLDRARRQPERVRLFWCTKSSAPLPVAPLDLLSTAPPRMRAWMRRGRPDAATADPAPAPARVNGALTGS